MAKSKRHPARRPQQRAVKRPHPGSTSAAKAQARSGGKASTAAVASPASGFRRQVEVRSAPILLRLNRLPRWFVPAALGLCLVGGLLFPQPWSAVLLIVVTLFLAWLLALSWPLLDGKGRVLRLAAVALLLGVMVVRVAGGA